MASGKGKVYLIPTVISPDTEASVLSKSAIGAINNSDKFLVENIRTARRFLSKIFKQFPEANRISLEKVDFEIFNKKTLATEIEELMAPLKNGLNIGIISESGCPGIADPGAEAVKWAHLNDIEVIPIPGPSSIYLALMASGLNGQSFSFHGYLPIDSTDLKKRIREYEVESRKNNQTKVFIETPYRNSRTFESLIANLSNEVLLTIASDLTGANQFVMTKTVKKWRSNIPKLDKNPTVFLLLAYS